jgi:hypothetical protein
VGDVHVSVAAVDDEICARLTADGCSRSRYGGFGSGPVFGEPVGSKVSVEKVVNAPRKPVAARAQ